ncbi:MAG TPA: sulfite exporter TauE/SafE family protein [Demequinaceae bacterium]
MGQRGVTEPVAGMHCSACEARVNAEFAALPGIQSVRANARRGEVTYVASARFDHAKAERALAAHGYVLGARPYWLSRQARVWRDVAIGLVGVAIVATLARFGVFSFAQGWVGALDGATLALPLLLGVAAGFSSCLATVGGLVLAVSASSAEGQRVGSVRASLRPHLVFNAGRVLGFGALGALTGALGHALIIGPVGLAVAMIVAGVAMVAVSMQMTVISPRLAGLAPRLPRWARVTDADGATGGRSPAGRDLRAAALGVASFFVPCGFTQAVQLFALSTGDPWRGGLVLAAFALGTTPALLLLGSAPALAQGRWRETFVRIAGVAVMAFAFVNVAAAVSTLGLSISPKEPLPTATTSNVTMTDGVQVATLATDGAGYVPVDTVVYAGIPVRWEITGNGLGCSSAIHAPELGVPPDTLIGYGKTEEFTFTLRKPGRVTYTCVMGMYSGTMTAIAPPP